MEILSVQLDSASFSSRFSIFWFSSSTWDFSSLMSLWLWPKAETGRARARATALPTRHLFIAFPFRCRLPSASGRVPSAPNHTVKQCEIVRLTLEKSNETTKTQFYGGSAGPALVWERAIVTPAQVVLTGLMPWRELRVGGLREADIHSAPRPLKHLFPFAPDGAEDGHARFITPRPAHGRGGCG